MKKVALMVLVAAFAASPALAAKKKGKMSRPAEQVDLNANGKRLFVDAIPSLLPGPVKFIYFHNKN
jgi:hypothetical protein